MLRILYLIYEESISSSWIFHSVVYILLTAKKKGTEWPIFRRIHLLKRLCFLKVEINKWWHNIVVTPLTLKLNIYGWWQSFVNINEVRYLQKFYHKKKYAMMFSFFHIKVGGVNPIPFKVPDGNQWHQRRYCFLQNKSKPALCYFVEQMCVVLNCFCMI